MKGGDQSCINRLSFTRGDQSFINKTGGYQSFINRKGGCKQ